MNPVRLWMDEAGHLHLTPTDRRKEYVALPAAEHAALVAERDALAVNVTGLRAKNHALNLRAQQAEGIIAKSGIVEGRYQGSENRSLGRALANYAASLEYRRAESLKVERDEARAQHAALVALLGDLQEYLDTGIVDVARAVALSNRVTQAFAALAGLGGAGKGNTSDEGKVT